MFSISCTFRFHVEFFILLYLHRRHDAYKRFNKFKRHRYDDIIMGFYGKAFDNGLQAKAAGSKPILFPANQNLGRSGLYHS